MHVEIDQSGKIGDTQVPTVLAFTNTERYAILISAEVKRECVRRLRTRYRQVRQPYIRLFAAALCLLLEEHVPHIRLVVIDEEYPGHEATIKGMLLNHIRKKVHEFPKEGVLFRRIGRHSAAHERAYGTYVGKEKPDRAISAEELLSLV